MEDRKIREIAREEIARSQRGGSPFVAPHQHDGVSNIQIAQKDVVPNDVYDASIQSVASETIVLRGITAYTEVRFYGFAANNAGGGGATQRAVITGSAMFGKGTFVTQLDPINGTPVQVAQASSYMFTNETGPAFRVGQSAVNLAYAVNDAGTVVATATVIQFTKGSITIDISLAIGWQLNGSYLIT